MQRHDDNLAARINGNALQPLQGASVSVTDDATGLPATLYSDNGVTVLAQPLTTGNEGQYGFYAADGKYTLTFSGVRFTTFTRKLILEDPLDNPYATQAALAAPSGAAGIGTSDGTLVDSINMSPVASGPRDAIVYNSNISVKVFRNFAAMGGFRYRGHYTKGRARSFPMPASKVASLDTDLGAGMTAATFENWYAVFACANNADATATLKIMPFLRAGTVAGSNVPLIKAGEGVHALTAASYAWGAANNLANTECLVISEGGNFSGRVTTITANSASQVTLASIGTVTAYDFLLPAPPGYTNYVYLGSFYFDTAEVRNIYDSAPLVKAKMIYILSPAMNGAVATSLVMNCAGYISPLATAVVIDSTATLSTASVGDLAEYFDPDGSNHVVQTKYLYKASTSSQAYVNDGVTVPFIYFQKFNYSNAGALNASRVSGQLNITGWIEP